MTDSGVGAQIDRLAGVWSALRQAVDEAFDNGSVSGRMGGAFPLAWGWHRTVLRQGQACWELINADLSHETAPLRRSILEHTIHLLALAKYPEDLLEAHVLVHQYESSRLLKNTAAMGLDYETPELRAFLDAQLPSNSRRHLTKTTEAARDVGAVDHLGYWSSDSRLLHPSIVSARVFHYDNEDDEVLLCKEPRDGPRDGPDGDNLAAAAVSVLCLTDATDALNRLTRDPPFTDAIRIARQAQV